MGGAPFIAELLGALPAFFDDTDSDGVKDEGAVAIPLGALDPADRVSIRGSAELSAGDAAEIIGNDVVIADAAGFAVNAVEKLDEFNGLDVEAGFFADLANDAGG
jgi:hypothetical protein